MAQLHFTLPPAECGTRLSQWDRALLMAADRQPRIFDAHMENGKLTITPYEPESGSLYVPCRVEGFGDVYIGTAHLMFAQQPYPLALELARGQVNRLRNQLGRWELIGWTPSDSVEQSIREATVKLSQAVRADQAAQAQLSHESLYQALWCSEQMVDEYARQIIEKDEFAHHLRSRLGAEIDPQSATREITPRFTSLFTHARVPLRWKKLAPAPGEFDWSLLDQQLGWCEEAGVAPTLGPLIDFRPHLLPDWLANWADDPQMLVTFMTDLVETCAARYRDKIDHWLTVARTNRAELYGLKEPQMLWITKHLLETVHAIDKDARVSFLIAQPWGDYWPQRRSGLPPFAFVDSLLRSFEGMLTIQLEIAMGYPGVGSHARTLLDVNTLLEQYIDLGVPLAVSLAFPSESVGKSVESAGEWHAPPSEQSQASWMEKVVRLCLSKPQIEQVFWSSFQDSVQSDWPGCGLLASDGTLKLAYGRLAGMITS